jgi:hypothetical protein
VNATRRFVVLVVLLGASLAAGACRSGVRSREGAVAAGGGASAGPTAEPPASPAGGEISLTDRDLAPMDAWVRRRYWILGDDVEIVASKEYFVQTLSIAARVGLVQRRDEEGAEEARSVLTFLGTPQQLDVTTAPRVMLGTGVTVTARRTLTLRLVRTRDANYPVRVRITARGKASLGSGNEVQRRDETLVVGAQLRRLPYGGYQLEER